MRCAISVYLNTCGGVRHYPARVIDTDVNDETFFVRKVYGPCAADRYPTLTFTRKTAIDAEAWSSLDRDVSGPFANPTRGRALLVTSVAQGS